MLRRRIRWVWLVYLAAALAVVMVLWSAQHDVRLIVHGRVRAGVQAGVLFFITPGDGTQPAIGSSSQGLAGQSWEVLVSKQYVPALSPTWWPAVGDVAPGSWSGTGLNSGKMLSLPLAGPTVALLATAGVGLGLRRRVLSEGRCANCGYPVVTGSNTARCPECGREPTDKNGRTRLSRWRVAATMGVVAIVGFGAATVWIGIGTKVQLRIPWKLMAEVAAGELRLVWSGHEQMNWPVPAANGWAEFRSEPMTVPQLAVRWRPVHMAANPWPKPSPLHTIAFPLWPAVTASVLGCGLVFGRLIQWRRDRANAAELK